MIPLRLSLLRSAWFVRIVGVLSLVALVLGAAGDRMAQRSVDAVPVSVVLAGLHADAASRSGSLPGERAWVGLASAPHASAVSAGGSGSRSDVPLFTADRCWAVDPASDHAQADPDMSAPVAGSGRVPVGADRRPPAPDLPGLLRPPSA